MRLLLDTHIFLWSVEEPERIPPALLAAMADSQNELWLSVASVWEIQIKIHTGKLNPNPPLPDAIETQQELNALRLLPVTLDHIWALGDLAPHHKDPFDRLLIAQAIAEGLTLVTVDPKFPLYPVKLLSQ